MKVPANTLRPQFELFREEYLEAAGRVLRSGWYVLGKEVEAFEEEFARGVMYSNEESRYRLKAMKRICTANLWSPDTEANDIKARERHDVRGY